MSRAVITIEDRNGLIEMKTVFEGDFDPKSNAHQHAYLLVKHVDEMSTRQEPAPETAEAAH